MDFKTQVGQMDRTRFTLGHNDTVLAQAIFGPQAAREFMDVLAYDPCWAMLNPGMTLEAHHHPNPEFYVFVSGDGVMTLNGEAFDVHNGMAVNIPPDVVHQVANSASAIQPLIWVSVALKV
jgi:mannose-6-phosphate isomerase-like protein (cupin superfamily)